jgi:hypothetical protein
VYDVKVSATEQLHQAAAQLGRPAEGSLQRLAREHRSRAAPQRGGQPQRHYLQPSAERPYSIRLGDFQTRADGEHRDVVPCRELTDEVVRPYSYQRGDIRHDVQNPH